MKKLRTGVIGLGFGSNFAKLLQLHPDAECVGICQRTESRLNEVGAAFGIPAEQRHRNYHDLLARDDVDAIINMTDLPFHAEVNIAALRAGKHVASTVPIGLTMPELRKIQKAAAEAGTTFMMMETTVRGRYFMFLHEMMRRGAFGRIQAMEADHVQDMHNKDVDWPASWDAMTPEQYATHKLSPMAFLLGRPVQRVMCVGSGRLTEARIAANGGYPFAKTIATYGFRDSDVFGYGSRSLDDCADPYSERFSVTGMDQSVWFGGPGDAPQHHLFVRDRSEDKIAEPLNVPKDFGSELIPESLRPYNDGEVTDEEHQSFVQGGGHDGSHPHMLHEFVVECLGQENPYAALGMPVMNLDWALNICVTGLLAKASSESTTNGWRKVPDWAMPTVG